MTSPAEKGVDENGADGACSSDARVLCLPESATTETQDTIESPSRFDPEPEGRHQLVRRYTEDLDNERIFLEL